eukprot:3933524-Rhodomonas_salina.1
MQEKIRDGCAMIRVCSGFSGVDFGVMVVGGGAVVMPLAELKGHRGREREEAPVATVVAWTRHEL